MISQFLLLILASSFFAKAETRNRFETQHPWYAVSVTDHFATGKGGCMAFTIADRRKARLEIYMENLGQNHTRPTVMIVTDGYEDFVSANMFFPRLRIPLTKATFHKNMGSIQAAMVRFGDRDRVLELLKEHGTANIRFRNKAGRIFKDIQFSLKNSELVIDKALQTCRPQ